MRDHALRTTALVAILGAGLALEGCQSFKEATGATKSAPDEFTVLTKAPLVIPPDFNLRPPQPGVASRNAPDADAQAQAALFANPTEQAGMLGDSYSDGEKLLLAKTNALSVDPSVRRVVNSDVGQEDQGPQFTQKVLYEGANPPPRATASVQPTAPAQSQGWFSRNLGFGSGGSETASNAPAAVPVTAPTPAVTATQVQPQPAIPVTVAAPPTTVIPQTVANTPLANAADGPTAALPPAAELPPVTDNSAVPAVAPVASSEALTAPADMASTLASSPPALRPDANMPAPAADVAAAPPAVAPPAAVAVAPARGEAKNLYQYLFGTPASAATITPTPAVAQAPAPAALQPAPVIAAPPTAPIPQAQPVPAAAPTPGAAQPDSGGDVPWYVRVFGTRPVPDAKQY